MSGGEIEVENLVNLKFIMIFECVLKKDMFFKIYKNYIGFYVRNCIWFR